MTKEQIEDLRYIGFEVKEDKDGFAVESETVPDLLQIELLLSVCTFWEAVHYWDADWESPTDPGAYVCAIRWDAKHIAYKEANYCWTSRWRIVTIEEMAKHVQLNWDKDCNDGRYLNRVIIEYNKNIDRERIRKNLYEEN